MSRPTLRICFDYVSPYSYLAWTQIHALAERHGREVDAVPVLLGALLDAHGTHGPAEIPAKRAYVVKDVARVAHALGVPLVPPPAHPFNSLLALRVSSLPMPTPVRKALIDGLFAAVWARGTGVTEPAAVAANVREAGLPDSVLADAVTPDGKRRLHEQTAEALAAGAFGVPTMFADGELFFGVDSLPHLEQFLRGCDPVSVELVERWARLPVGASRKR